MNALFRAMLIFISGSHLLLLGIVRIQPDDGEWQSQ